MTKTIIAFLLLSSALVLAAPERTENKSAKRQIAVNNTILADSDAGTSYWQIFTNCTEAVDALSVASSNLNSVVTAGIADAVAKQAIKDTVKYCRDMEAAAEKIARQVKKMAKKEALKGSP
jgi:hypothetical protein